MDGEGKTSVVDDIPSRHFPSQPRWVHVVVAVAVVVGKGSVVVGVIVVMSVGVDATPSRQLPNQPYEVHVVSVVVVVEVVLVVVVVVVILVVVTVVGNVVVKPVVPVGSSKHPHHPFVLHVVVVVLVVVEVNFCVGFVVLESVNFQSPQSTQSGLSLHSATAGYASITSLITV